jgi:hypothetical protein
MGSGFFVLVFILLDKKFTTYFYSMFEIIGSVGGYVVVSVCVHYVFNTWTYTSMD